MMRTLLLIACLFWPAVALSQRLEQPRRVRLRVIVSYQGGQLNVQYATVELMDALGSSSAMDKQTTDQDGRVEFNTITGAHRIRITGTDFYPYEGDFEIAPAESYHVENFGVRRRSEGRTTSVDAMNIVPAIRLKIPDSAREEFQKGSKAMEGQKWGESRKHFQVAVDLYPDYDLAYNGLGMVQVQLNDLEAARRSFSKAIDLNPGFSAASRNLARISFGQRKYEEADNLLVKSLEGDPTNVWALSSAANAELLIHKYVEAIAHARKAHSVPHAGLAGVHIVAALALEATERPVDAVKEYELYLDEDPKGRDAERAQKAIARLKAQTSK